MCTVGAFASTGPGDGRNVEFRNGSAHVVIVPHYGERPTIGALDLENARYSFASYQNQADVPDPYAGTLGHRTTITAAGVVTRDNYAVGFYACCLAPRYEQIWTYTIYGPDASNQPTVQLQSYFAHQTTDTNNQPCWDGVFCGATSVDYFPWWQIDCTWKRGNYKAVVYYSGRNSATETMSTTTSIFERTWSLDFGKNALSLGLSPTPLQPGIDSNTGYAGFGTFTGGTSTLTVRSYDCGAVPNVAFTLTREWVEDSNGHVHINGNGAPANLDAAVRIDAMSGTTDANGNWTTTVHGGTVAGTVKVVATSNSFLGSPRSSLPFPLLIGFKNFIDPGIGLLDVNIRYTGMTSAIGQNHSGNHYGSGELHNFVREFADMYNIEALPAHQGSLGINDMSLEYGGVFDLNGTFTPQSDPPDPNKAGHYRHRLGTDVDVDQVVLAPDGSTPDIQKKLLTKIVEQELDGFRVIEGSGHLHFQIPEYQASDVLLRATK